MPRKIMKSDKYVDDVAPARPKKAGITKSQSTRRAIKKDMWSDSSWGPNRNMTFAQYHNYFTQQNAKKNPAMTTANAGMPKPPKLPPPMPKFNNPWARIEGGRNELPKEKPIRQYDPGFSPKNSPNWQEPFDPNNPHHTWQKFHPNIMISPIFRDWDKTHPKKKGFDL